MKFITSAIVAIMLLSHGRTVSFAQSDSNHNGQTKQETKAGQEAATRKANIKSKPAPKYPKEAKETSEYQVSAMVKLRMTLGATGQVSNIQVINVVTSDGVSEKLKEGFIREAVKAASKIKFEPAEKDGRKVSQYVSIEYNFNVK
jgi:TonB family protein